VVPPIAILLAAGRGRRLGRDKALVDLGGRPAIARAVANCRAGGCGEVRIVRRAGAAPLPPIVPPVRLIDAGDGEMIDSLRAALQPPPEADLLLLPIDHAMVSAGTIARLVVRALTGPPRIRLPLYGGRPGHPILLPAAIAAELSDPTTTTLRDVVRRDPARVEAIEVDDPWVLRDLDLPEDLAAAQRSSAALPLAPTELMRAHRSRRSFRPDPVPPEQLARLVDAARHAATSSLMQAYSIVAVRDPVRKARIAELCARQSHILEAPLFLGVCADLYRLRLACERHQEGFAGDSLEIFVQATIDAAIVGENLLLAAESEGLGGCFLGAAREHPVELAAELGLPPQVYVPFGLVLGHPSDDPLPRGRMPLSGILHDEQYDAAAAAAALAAADEQMRDWARRVNAEQGGFRGRRVNEARGWTDRMADLWSSARAQPKGRAHLPAALRMLGFRFEQ
jgi:FMN reductase (NADPH)